MSDLIFNLINEDVIVIKESTLKVLKELDLNLNEFILLTYLLNHDNMLFDISLITKKTYLTDEEVMESFSSLAEKGIVSLSVKDKKGLKEEYIDLTVLKQMIYESFTSVAQKKETTNLFEIIENSLGITLSPTDYALINDWLDQGLSESLIKEAIKEAVNSNAKSLRYISKILLSWKDAGYQSAKDVERDLKRGIDATGTINLTEVNWLDE